jgi:hypothetical protein
MSDLYAPGVIDMETIKKGGLGSIKVIEVPSTYQAQLIYPN